MFGHGEYDLAIEGFEFDDESAGELYAHGGLIDVKLERTVVDMLILDHFLIHNN